VIPNPANHRESPGYLRELVERAQMSQEEIADACGIARRTFRRYLSSEASISYPVQFTVECFVAHVEEERLATMPRQLATTPRRELQAVERKLTRVIESTPNASRLRQRVKATLARVQRAAARRD
jgi:transcriptional regulator with XRE-family HTH domain